ncbi:hypothetical protein [Ornithinimicrobium kibberense]|uniref:hypothetical protein n=1 Tax=Ornithinimicrobium kibberense TaxID=282060 RepID=UPI00361A1CA9
MPADGRSSRLTMRARVDLPEPDGPTTPMTWPRSTRRPTSSSAVTAGLRRRAGKVLETCCRVITVVPHDGQVGGAPPGPRRGGRRARAGGRKGRGW